MKTYEAIIGDKPAAIGRTPIIHNNIVYALTQKGNIFICDKKDFELVEGHKIYESSTGYVYAGHGEGARLQNKLRVKMGIQSHMIIDHIDRNPLNNTRFNLRPATARQNALNQARKRSVNPYIGVTRVYRKKSTPYFQALVSINKKATQVGVFRDALEAALARDRANLFFNGEFGLLNFPKNKEKYLAEIKNGVNIIIKNPKIPGKISKETSYMFFCNTKKRWMVMGKAGDKKIVGRFKTKEEAITFRNIYYSSTVPAGKEMYCKIPEPALPSL